MRSKGFSTILSLVVLAAFGVVLASCGPDRINTNTVNPSENPSTDTGSDTSGSDTSGSDTSSDDNSADSAGDTGSNTGTDTSSDTGTSTGDSTGSDSAGDTTGTDSGSDTSDTITDTDSDGVNDDTDNCIDVANADQLDTDADAAGDVCDTDDDADAVADESDNCVLVSNADQADIDADTLGDVCDDDADGDGFLASVDDCNDLDAAINSDAVEVADFQDNDCDGTSDNFSLSGADLLGLGSAASDQFGKAVASVGDVNGDGYADVVVSAPYADNGRSGNVGKVYLFKGASTAEEVSITSADADAVFVGEAAGDLAGSAVAGLGDINGDGYADFAIASPENDDAAGNAGKIHIVFGADDDSADATPAVLTGELSLADVASASLPGVTITGVAASDKLGSAIAGGDLDGDGLADLVVGASRKSSSKGKVYVFAGTSLTSGTTVSSSSAEASFAGEFNGDLAGTAVDVVGDLDGDGAADLVVGAPQFDNGADSNAGRAYVIYGSTALFDGTYAAADLADADATITGSNDNDYLGQSLDGVEDINGDGSADFAVSAYQNDDAATQAGQVYIFTGSATRLSADNDAATATISFTGVSASEHAGYSTASAGDMNGDGLGDLVIGAKDNSAVDTGAGRVYVVLGASDLAGQVSLSNADMAFDGEVAGDFAGAAVAKTGAIVGGSSSGVLIGAYGADDDTLGSAVGAAYLIVVQ